MKKKNIRILVDCGMVMLLPLLMAYSLVGETVHEYLGIGMFLLFVIHHILNIAWWKHIFRGKYTSLRVLGTVVNLAHPCLCEKRNQLVSIFANTVCIH